MQMSAMSNIQLDKGPRQATLCLGTWQDLRIDGYIGFVLYGLGHSSTLHPVGHG